MAIEIFYDEKNGSKPFLNVLQRNFEEENIPFFLTESKTIEKITFVKTPGIITLPFSNSQNIIFSYPEHDLDNVNNDYYKMPATSEAILSIIKIFPFDFTTANFCIIGSGRVGAPIYEALFQLEKNNKIANVDYVNTSKNKTIKELKSYNVLINCSPFCFPKDVKFQTSLYIDCNNTITEEQKTKMIYISSSFIGKKTIDVITKRFNSIVEPKEE